MIDWRPSHTRGLEAFDAPTRIWLEKQVAALSPVVECSACPRKLRASDVLTARDDLARSCPRNRHSNTLPCPMAVNHEACA